MRFVSVIRVSHCKNKPPLLSSFHSKPTRNSFGIAFDIDGVILRGRAPIGGSPQALRRLYDDSGALKVPFLFLTNGGGIPETRRAAELSKLLGVSILPAQFAFFMAWFCRDFYWYENELIIATGKGEPAEVMADYGFKKVLSLEEYATYFENIDPVSQYKNWTVEHAVNKRSIYEEFDRKYDVFTDTVQAAFVISDPVDWGRDIQVLCDILTSGGLPGLKKGHQPALYFAADDLEYQAAFPSERLGMGAFRIALESVFNSIHHRPLHYVSYGKPNPFVFKNAEAILNQLHLSLVDEDAPLKNLYMIGDNPPVDIKGAQQAGHPWFSILTRTGVFRGKDNDADYPADMVVDTVEEAMDFILSRECSL